MELTSTVLLLRSPQVGDLGEFVRDPQGHLVDAYREPALAADLWHHRTGRSPLVCEGLLQLRLDGTDLIPSTLWEDVDALWRVLLELAAVFVAGTPTVERAFPSHPVRLALHLEAERTLLHVGEEAVAVDGATFCAALAGEGLRWLDWVDTHVGSNTVRPRSDAAAVLAAVPPPQGRRSPGTQGEPRAPGPRP